MRCLEEILFYEGYRTHSKLISIQAEFYGVVNNRGKIPGCENEKAIAVYLDGVWRVYFEKREIDKAKKEFDVNAELEIKKIKAKHIEKTDDGKMVKPEFLGYIAKTKGYYNPEKKCYRYHDTTMDYLVKIISSSRSRKSGAKSFIPFSDCFRFEE